MTGRIGTATRDARQGPIDLLLLNEGAGRGWRRTDVPGDVPGCGRTAAAVDFDRDGMDDAVVLNGGGRFGPGPDQLLTMGRWEG